MDPVAVVLNVAIVVAILGIIVYWVRRFAVFRGYRSIQPDVLRIASLLGSQPTREGSDVVVPGMLSGVPTFVRFSYKLDTPGLNIKMWVPSTINFFLLPRNFGGERLGRAVLRTGSAALDGRFIARSDQPMEARMLIAIPAILACLEQLCCSTQTGTIVENGTLEFSELTVPAYTGNHVLDHLTSMVTIAKALHDMPGASQIKVPPLPPRGSSVTIRVALAVCLLGLVGLLFAQPYGRTSSASGNALPPSRNSGVAPADAPHIQRLEGWQVARSDDFRGNAIAFFREHSLPVSGHVAADFSNLGKLTDSAYLLVNAQGQKRVNMQARGATAYDAIFPQADLLARIPKSNFAKITWTSPPEFAADGDALLVVQKADDRTASVVLYRHGPQTFSARPADFTTIDLTEK